MINVISGARIRLRIRNTVAETWTTGRPGSVAG